MIKSLSIILFVVLTFVGNVFAQDQVASGNLIAYFPFDGTVEDVVGNNPVTKNGNLTFTSSEVGQAVVFDGQSFLQLSGEPFALEEWTISFRIFVDNAPPQYWNSVIAKRSVNSEVTGKYNWGFFYYPGYWLDSQYEICDSDEDHLLHFGYDLRPGAWYRVTGTYGDGIQEMYVNGKLGNSIYRGDVPCANNEPLIIGGVTTDLAYMFEGKIDELRIYNKRLSAQEIKNIDEIGVWVADTPVIACAVEGFIKVFPNVIKNKGVKTKKYAAVEIYGYAPKNSFISINGELFEDLPEGRFTFLSYMHAKNDLVHSVNLYSSDGNLIDSTNVVVMRNKDYDYIKIK